MNTSNRRFLIGCLVVIHTICLLLISLTTFQWINPKLNLSLLISQITLVAIWQALGSTPSFRRHVIAGLLYCLLILSTGFHSAAAFLVVVLVMIIQIILWFQKRRGFHVVCLRPGERDSPHSSNRLTILDLLLSQVLIALLAFIYTHTDVPQSKPQVLYFVYGFCGVLMPHVVACVLITCFATWVCLTPDYPMSKESASYASVISVCLFFALLFATDREQYLLMQFFIYSSLLVIRSTQYRILGSAYKKTKFRNAWPTASKPSQVEELCPAHPFSRQRAKFSTLANVTQAR